LKKEIPGRERKYGQGAEMSSMAACRHPLSRAELMTSERKERGRYGRGKTSSVSCLKGKRIPGKRDPSLASVIRLEKARRP